MCQRLFNKWLFHLSYKHTTKIPLKQQQQQQKTRPPLLSVPLMSVYPPFEYHELNTSPCKEKNPKKNNKKGCKKARSFSGGWVLQQQQFQQQQQQLTQTSHTQKGWWAVETLLLHPFLSGTIAIGDSSFCPKLIHMK